MRVAVLITCHNRREKTVACLDSLFAQLLGREIELETWLVDDGGTDGTVDAVRLQFPQVRILQGDGSLFWCAGMRFAWSRAAETKPDAFLWLNDDVRLDPHAVAGLQAVGAEHPECIAVGSCTCPQTGRRSYGGLRRIGAHPGKLSAIEPMAHTQPCDTFEGNIVWIPAAVFARLGLLGPYQHSMGDIDYGYRATRAGIASVLAPGFFGSCAANSKQGTWEDTEMPWRARLRKLGSIKGLPAPDWWRFCREHGGMMAPFYFLGPFLRVARRR